MAVRDVVLCCVGLCWRVSRGLDAVLCCCVGVFFLLLLGYEVLRCFVECVEIWVQLRVGLLSVEYKALMCVCVVLLCCKLVDVEA